MSTPTLPGVETKTGAVGVLALIEHAAACVDSAALDFEDESHKQVACDLRLEVAPAVMAVMRTAEAVLASPMCANYRLISPFRELAAAIANAKGAAP